MHIKLPVEGISLILRRNKYTWSSDEFLEEFKEGINREQISALGGISWRLVHWGSFWSLMIQDIAPKRIETLRKVLNSVHMVHLK